MQLSGMSTSVVTPPAAAARVAVVEALPLGAARLVDVDVAVDEPGRDHQVADVDDVRQRDALAATTASIRSPAISTVPGDTPSGRTTRRLLMPRIARGGVGLKTPAPRTVARWRCARSSAGRRLYLRPPGILGHGGRLRAERTPGERGRARRQRHPPAVAARARPHRHARKAAPRASAAPARSPCGGPTRTAGRASSRSTAAWCPSPRSTARPSSRSKASRQVTACSIRCRTRWSRAGGSQCGYCTPGFVVSLFCEYYRPGRDGFDPEAISGNLCRCTGYRPIADVARTLPAPAADDPRLAELAAPVPPRTRVDSGHGVERFVRPTSLDELFRCLAEAPAATLIAGGTDVMVGVTQKGDRHPLVVSLEALPELRAFAVTPEAIVLGAGLTLTELEEHLHARPRPPSRCSTAPAAVLVAADPQPRHARRQPDDRLADRRRPAGAARARRRGDAGERRRDGARCRCASSSSATARPRRARTR